jgi:hypothetical protein
MITTRLVACMAGMPARSLGSFPDDWFNAYSLCMLQLLAAGV